MAEQAGGRTQRPAVSVVVISRNRRDRLLATLPRLLALPERPPVVLVDNGSVDGTAAAVRGALPEVCVIPLAGNAGAAGRTVGVRAASTPYVAFADDDSWWAPGALARAARAFDLHPRLGLLAARVLVGPDGQLDPTSALMAGSPLGVEPDLPGPSVLGFLACGAVVRREAYLAAGGFPSRFGVGGEEAPLAVELARRGWGLAYADAVVAHHHPATGRPDRSARTARELRNAVWQAVLHRPWPVVARRLAGTARRAVVDPRARAGLLEAVAGLGPVLAARTVVGPALEARLRLLEGPHGQLPSSEEATTSSRSSQPTG